MISHYRYDREKHELTLAEEGTEGVFWIHLDNPSDEELQRITEQFRLPRDYLYSALDPDEIPRVEKIELGNYNEPALVVFSYPITRIDSFENEIFETRPLSVVLTNDKIITAVENTPDFLPEVISHRENHSEEEVDKEDVVLDLALRISRLFVTCLKRINSSIGELERSLNVTIKNEQLYKMIGLEKSVVFFEIAIKGNNPVVEAMKRQRRFNDSRDSSELIRDVNVENRQAERMVEQTGELLKQLNQLYSSIVSNNLNLIMKVLTSITIVLTIPTIIGGIWGMNLALPFEGSPYGFWIVMLIMGLVSALVIWILKKFNYF